MTEVAYGVYVVAESWQEGVAQNRDRWRANRVREVLEHLDAEIDDQRKAVRHLIALSRRW